MCEPTQKHDLDVIVQLMVVIELEKRPPINMHLYNIKGILLLFVVAACFVLVIAGCRFANLSEPGGSSLWRAN